MTDRPIIFNAPMVCALINGRKKQTRRFLKPPFAGASLQSDTNGAWWWWAPGQEKEHVQARMPYSIGDRLWVREAFCWGSEGEPGAKDFAIYRANYYSDNVGDRLLAPWLPSIHMPRWASRLTLTVTDVRVERVQEISKDDAIAEGIHPAHIVVGEFSDLWDSIYGKKPGRSWADNPWVVALTFDVVQQNIDELGG